MTEATPDPGELTYTEASAELDAILRELDAGDVDVDTLEHHFERAIALVEELDRRLRRTRDKVDRLAPRLEHLAERPGHDGSDDGSDDGSEDGDR